MPESAWKSIRGIAEDCVFVIFDERSPVRIEFILGPLIFRFITAIMGKFLLQILPLVNRFITTCIDMLNKKIVRKMTINIL